MFIGKNNSGLLERRFCSLKLLMMLLATIPMLAQNQSAELSRSPTPQLILQSAHSGVVKKIAFSPDGTLLLSVGTEGTLKLWDVRDGRELQTIDIAELLSGGQSPTVDKLKSSHIVRDIAFIPDGKGIVVAVGNGVILAKFGGSNVYLRQPDFVEGVACDPHGRWVAIGSVDGLVTILDANDFHVVRTLNAHTGPVLAVAISPDGARLVAGGLDSALSLWDVPRGKRLRVLMGHTDYIRTLVFSADGQTLVSGSDERSIKVWNASTGVLQKTLSVGRAVQGLAISDDGRLLASASEGMQAELWDAQTGSIVKAWGGTDASKYEVQDFNQTSVHMVTWSSGGVAFSPKGHLLAIGTAGTVQLWNVNPTDPNPLRLVSTLGVKADIVSAKFSPAGHYLAVAQDRYMALWDLRLGRPRSYLWFGPGAPGTFYSSQFSPDENVMIAGYSSKLIRMWDIKTAQLIRRIPTSVDVRTLAFSHDGALLAAGSLDGSVEILDAASGAEVHTLNQSLNKGVPSMVFHPDRPWLALASSRGYAISVWDSVTGRKIKDIDCEPPQQLIASLGRVSGASGPCGVNGLAVDKSNGSLAATGNFGARLWAGPDWKRVRVRLEGDATLGQTALAARVPLWVEGTSVWDLFQHREAFKLSTHVDSPSFSSDSKWLVSAGHGELALWDTAQRAIVGFLISTSEDEWAVVTPDGLFDGSPQAWTDIMWRFGDKLGDVLPVEAFFSDL